MLDNLKSSLTNLNITASSVHQQIIVNLLPHIIVADPLYSLKYCWLEMILNKVCVMVTQLGECDKSR
jgi:hypothetical protein